MRFEFLIPKRPVSLQTKNRKNLQAWKDFVLLEAKKAWLGNSSTLDELHLTLVYLYYEDPVDVDNIIKPIQDALVGLVYNDDLAIVDVESHRRPLSGPFEILKYPRLLAEGILGGGECVYVRVTDAKPLEDFL